MVNLMLFFILMMIVVLIVLTDKEIAAAETNVLFAVAEKLFPAPWAYLAVLSTLLSTIGTIEPQILQLSRSLFAMGRSNMLNARLAHVHAEWRTPLSAMFAQWAFGIALLDASSFMPSVGFVLESSISAIGLPICFYMSLAAVDDDYADRLAPFCRPVSGLNRPLEPARIRCRDIAGGRRWAVGGLHPAGDGAANALTRPRLIRNGTGE
jgi:Amino acid permease